MNERQPQYFTPSSKNIPATTEQNTQPDALVPTGAITGLKLEALPIRGLNGLIFGVLAVLLFIGAWQVIEVYQKALAIHWLLATSFAALLGFVGVAAVRTLWQFLRGRRGLKQLANTRAQAKRLSESVDLGSAKSFIQQLQQHYRNTPQADLLEHSLSKLPSYSNDGEVISYLDNAFLAPLDEEATRRISAFSLQTAVGVSLSPWVTLDMALALWRNTKMIDEIAQVYGIRPSLATRLRLLKMVGTQLVLVGATEAAIDQFYDELSLDVLGTLAAARGMQGIGAGIYSIRIGIATMSVCRPIEFNQSNKPKFGKIASSMVEQAKKLLGKGKN